MCRTFAASVLALEDGVAVVDVEGRLRRADLLFMPGIRIGDWVLVAAGRVVRRLSPDEAATARMLLGQPVAFTTPASSSSRTGDDQ